MKEKYWNRTELENHVGILWNQDFSSWDFEDIKKLYDEETLSESNVYPTEPEVPTQSDLEDEDEYWLYDSCGEKVEPWESKIDDAIDDAETKHSDWQDACREQWPMGYVFHCTNNSVANILRQNVDELDAIGINMFDMPDGKLFLYIGGCGYNFYYEHWIPMYCEILDRVDESEFPKARY